MSSFSPLANYSAVCVHHTSYSSTYSERPKFLYRHFKDARARQTQITSYSFVSITIEFNRNSKIRATTIFFRNPNIKLYLLVTVLSPLTIINSLHLKAHLSSKHTHAHTHPQQIQLEVEILFPISLFKHSYKLCNTDGLSNNNNEQRTGTKCLSFVSSCAAIPIKKNPQLYGYVSLVEVVATWWCQKWCSMVKWNRSATLTFACTPSSPSDSMQKSMASHARHEICLNNLLWCVCVLSHLVVNYIPLRYFQQTTSISSNSSC